MGPSWERRSVLESFTETRPVRIYASSSNSHSSRKRHFLTLLVILYYLPPLLLQLGWLKFGWRFQILALMTSIMATYVWVRGFSLKELGFRTDTLKGSLVLNAIVTLPLVVVMLLSFEAGLIRDPTPPMWGLFFAHYVFVSSPSQEFLFRSNLFALMRRSNIERPALQILLSAATFSFMHVVYNDPLTLLVTLAIGLLWGAIYYKYPNFWGVALSHAAVGAVAVKVGVV